MAGDALGGMGKTWPLCDIHSLLPVVRSIEGLKNEEHETPTVAGQWIGILGQEQLADLWGGCCV